MQMPSPPHLSFNTYAFTFKCRHFPHHVWSLTSCTWLPPCMDAPLTLPRLHHPIPHCADILLTMFSLWHPMKAASMRICPYEPTQTLTGCPSAGIPYPPCLSSDTSSWVPLSMNALLSPLRLSHASLGHTHHRTPYHSIRETPMLLPFQSTSVLFFFF